MRNAEEMTEEELREELVKIREERSGKGRERKKVARTKRIEGVRSDAKKRANQKAVEEADWV